MRLKFNRVGDARKADIDCCVVSGRVRTKILPCVVSGGMSLPRLFVKWKVVGGRHNLHTNSPVHSGKARKER